MERNFMDIKRYFMERGILRSKYAVDVDGRTL